MTTVNERTIIAPEAATLKLGASFRSKWDAKRITLFADTIAPKLPTPPASIAASRVKTVNSIAYGMMLNDELGDCTVVGEWHIVQTNTAIEKHPFVQADPLIRSEYFGLTGGVDSGLALLDVLKPWQKREEHGLAAYAEIPWTDTSLSAAESRKLLKQAIYLSGSAYIAVELPVAVQRNPYDWTQVGSGPDWRAGTWGGHCVPIVYYLSASGALTFYIVTWGKLVPVSEAFLRAYMPEAWMPVSRDYLNAKGNSPSGRSLQTIVDLAHQIAA